MFAMPLVGAALLANTSAQGVPSTAVGRYVEPDFNRYLFEGELLSLNADLRDQLAATLARSAHFFR